MEVPNGQSSDLKKERLLIGNGVVTDGVALFIEQGVICVENGVISWVGPLQETSRSDADFVDVEGRVIMPGFLNAHHHLYSSFAPGIAPLGETNKFVQILDNLWWSLDLALDAESIYYSALCGVIDSVKHGVTTIFDHHASMGTVRGSLEWVARAFNAAGIKGLLCFETSDRMGSQAVASHIEENLEFAAASAGSDVFGIFGLHANLTLSEETLKRVSAMKPPAMPVHIHCGEDLADLQYCRGNGYEGPVDRLHRFNLLTPDSILAHAIHLSERDYELIEEIRPIVVCNPESNANNRVGTMDRDLVRSYLLGTDGMSPDMVETLRSHYLLGGTIPFDELSSVFFEHRYQVQRHFFPGTGGLQAGMRADLAVLDYVPVTPIHLGNLLGHLIFGARAGKVYMTLAGGRVLYRAGHVLFADEGDVVQRARQAAMSLHRKYYQDGPFAGRA